MSELGTQLRQMADGGGSGIAKDLVASAADQADQVSRRLGEGGFDRTLADPGHWARNRPGLFLGVAAAAGFVVARVARSADTDSLKEAASPTSGDGGSTLRVAQHHAREPAGDPQPGGDSAPAPLGAGLGTPLAPTIGGGAAT